MPTYPDLSSMRAFAAARLAFALGLLALGACGEGSATPPATISAVTVAPATVTLDGVGSTATLSATLLPSAVSASVSWRSENPDIVSIAGVGSSATVTAIRGGTATVTATAGGVRGATTVTVVPQVRAIASPVTAQVVVGRTVRPTITITADAGASEALSFASSAANVATVSNDGTISGIAPGTATITVTSVATPRVTATIQVSVVLPTVRGVVISPPAPTLFIGQTRTLSAAVDVDSGSSTGVTWSTSAPSVATVSATGVVTAVAAGTAIITAVSVANPQGSGSTSVTVLTPTVRTVRLPATQTLVLSQTQTPTPTVDADPGANTTLLWTSADASIVHVSSAGVLTAVGIGTTTITARSQLVTSAQATMAVTVANAPPLVNWAPATISPAGSQTNSTFDVAYRAPNNTWWVHMDNFPLLRFDGTRWVETTVSVPGRIQDMSGVGETLWFMQTDGRVFRTDNAGSPNPTIVQEAIPGNPDIRLIKAVSPRQLIATSTTQVFVLDNGTWRTLPPYGDLTIFAVDATSLTDIVISRGTSNLLRRWNGTSWSTLPTPPFLTGALLLLLHGDQVIVRPDGETAPYRLVSGAWSRTTLPATRSGLSEAITRMVSCAGTVYASTANGARIYQLNGSTWTVVADYGVALPGGRGVRVACGEDGALLALGSEGMLGRMVNGTWRWERQSTRFTSVDLVRHDLAYAAGPGQIYRWNGVAWNPELTSGVARFGSVSATHDGMVVAGLDADVGTPDPGIFTKRGTGGWTHHPVQGDCSIAWAASQTFALAAGMGCSQRWNGTSWTANTPLEGKITGIGGAGENFALAVGWLPSGTGANNNLAYRWNGSSWQSISIPREGIPFRLRVHSPTLAYAINGVGGLLRWDGTSWAAVTFTGVGSVSASFVTINSPTDVYVVTRDDRVLQYDGVVWRDRGRIDGLRLGRSLQVEAGAVATIPGFGIATSNWGTPIHSNSLGSPSSRLAAPRRK